MATQGQADWPVPANDGALSMMIIGNGVEFAGRRCADTQRADRHSSRLHSPADVPPSPAIRRHDPERAQWLGAHSPPRCTSLVQSGEWLDRLGESAVRARLVAAAESTHLPLDRHCSNSGIRRGVASSRSCLQRHTKCGSARIQPTPTRLVYSREITFSCPRLKQNRHVATSTHGEAGE